MCPESHRYLACYGSVALDCVAWLFLQNGLINVYDPYLLAKPRYPLINTLSSEKVFVEVTVPLS